MASRQRTFELVPTTLVPTRGPVRAMTSKAAKKAHREATRVPRMPRAEQRRLEQEEREAQKKEYERERAATKARAAREKKAEKAAAERAARKKAGIPEPSKYVRPSQPTISMFVKTGTKRSWEQMRDREEIRHEEVQDEESGDESAQDNNVVKASNEDLQCLEEFAEEFSEDNEEIGPKQEVIEDKPREEEIKKRESILNELEEDIEQEKEAREEEMARRSEIQNQEPIQIEVEDDTEREQEVGEELTREGEIKRQEPIHIEVEEGLESYGTPLRQPVIRFVDTANTHSVLECDNPKNHENEPPPTKDMFTDDSDDEFGDFPSLSQWPVPKMLSETENDSETDDGISIAAPSPKAADSVMLQDTPKIYRLEEPKNIEEEEDEFPFDDLLLEELVSSQLRCEAADAVAKTSAIAKVQKELQITQELPEPKHIENDDDDDEFPFDDLLLEGLVSSQLLSEAANAVKPRQIRKEVPVKPFIAVPVPRPPLPAPKPPSVTPLKDSRGSNIQKIPEVRTVHGHRVSKDHTAGYDGTVNENHTVRQHQTIQQSHTVNTGHTVSAEHTVKQGHTLHQAHTFDQAPSRASRLVGPHRKSNPHTMNRPRGRFNSNFGSSRT